VAVIVEGFECATAAALRLMDSRNHANEEIEADAIAFLKTGRKDFRPDTRHPHLAVRLVSEPVVHVVRQLSVNADWLHPMKHRVATAF
jgi:hypothetical protein